jgi:purine-nucleoside phosphorylase
MYCNRDPDKAMEALRARGAEGPVDIGLVLGSGLASLVEDVENPLAMPYADLPGFPCASVSGHAGRLVIGTIGRLRVAVLQGRSHYYETGDPQGMRAPIEVLSRLGAHALLLTSAVGSVRPSLRPGALALVTDHLNPSGVNPLHNEPDDARFVAMNEAYDARLRRRLKRAASSEGMSLEDAVYMFFPGPSFETPAEIRMAALLGADVVGMSVVPECIVARRCGLEVAAVCAVTNLGAGLEGAVPSHDETKRMGAEAAVSLRRLLGSFMRTPDGI